MRCGARGSKQFDGEGISGAGAQHSLWEPKQAGNRGDLLTSGKKVVNWLFTFAQQSIPPRK
jgi:hypothetical protein